MDEMNTAVAVTEIPDGGFEMQPGFKILGSADEIADAWGALFATFPAGSRAEFRDGFWHFYRGAGVTSHGAGRTLSRAIKAVNSTMRRDKDTGRMEEVAEDGTVLSPE